MARTLPVECPHGSIVDWSDFGPARPEDCDHGCTSEAIAEWERDRARYGCNFQTYAETPTSPAEFCENDAEDGEDFCTDHLDMDDGLDPDEARDRALDYEMGFTA